MCQTRFGYQSPSHAFAGPSMRLIYSSHLAAVSRGYLYCASRMGNSCFFWFPGWREPLSLTFFSFFGGGGYAFGVISCQSLEALKASLMGARSWVRALATAGFNS